MIDYSFCTCTSCHYTFVQKEGAAPSMDVRCPDCGKHTIRPASQDEVSEFHRNWMEFHPGEEFPCGLSAM